MKHTICTIVLCIVLFSCKKEQATEPTKPTNTEHLSSKPWKYESGGADNNKDGTIDITLESTGMVQACHLDNTAAFHANGSGEGDEGTTKCSVSTPQTTPFSWNFTNNETALTITGSNLFGLSGQFKIIELNSTRLGLSKDTTIFGLATTVIVHLQHPQ